MLATASTKVARAENNCHDLSIMAKNVGSNFFLKDRRFSATLDFPFAALSAEGGAASAAPSTFAISKMVTPGGFGPPISGMKTQRPSPLDDGATIINMPS